MRFKFQSFFDVSTSASTMQILQFSVGGTSVFERCRHLFGAYKYFKLGRISVKMCPASTLPVDPLQLSYDLNDPQAVDPRDQMNPGLVRITNGEDIFTNISALSADQQQRMYTAMMLDPRWSKFMLQSGFRRSAYPLYWQIGQLHQDKFPGAIENVPFVNSSGVISNVTPILHANNNGYQSYTDADGKSSEHGLFQVGHRGRLGFLPTDYYQEIYNGTSIVGSSGANNIPQVSVITCVLPKAFKTLYFYRIYVTEEVIFSGLRSAPPVFNVSVPGGSTLRMSTFGIDQFLVGSPLETYNSGLNQYGETTAPAQRIANNGEDKP